MKKEFIIPYLPYGLTGVAGFAKDTPFVIDSLEITSIVGNKINGNHSRVSCYASEFYPILKPISEFSRNEIINIKTFMGGDGAWCPAYIEYFDIWFDDEANIDKLILQCPYELFQYFLYKHYDVFGLIESGMAINNIDKQWN